MKTILIIIGLITNNITLAKTAAKETQKIPTLIPVKIDLFEALAPKDSTSSERFQKEYLGAIETAKTLSDTSLKKCGYSLDTHPIFYNASDSLEALEKGKKSESENSWLIVGPRRSNHYLLLVKGAPNSATVSTMASSKEVYDLSSLHLSMAPSNIQMVKAATNEIKSRLKSTNYVSVVSEDCVACVDFDEEFAKDKKLKRLKTFKISGESPDLLNISKEVQKLEPDFILLPNYSKVSALAIAAFHKVIPSALFVGGDGWGDSKFGFVQNAKDLEGTKGFTVRGFPSVDKGILSFDLGNSILLDSRAPSPYVPGSASALSVLKIFDSLNHFLCKYKPKTRDEFIHKFKLNGKSSFKSPWGVSIYNLDAGDIHYLKTIK